MAFTIKNIIGADLSAISNSLNLIIKQTRFTARIETHKNKLTIHDVRLKEKKHYCGNHPFSCPVTPWEKPHKKGKWLEGADWVGFNDCINDVLDSLRVSANVASSLVIIRKGKKRCVSYSGHAVNEFNNEWDKDSGVFQDCIEKQEPVKSEYPEGTPGIASYHA